MSVLFLLSLQNKPWPSKPVLLKQILLKPAIYTVHYPHPSVMAHPMVPVLASFPPCFPHLHKTRVQLHLLTPLSLSLLTFPMIPAPCCLGPPPKSWRESADPDMVSVSAAAAGSWAGWVTTTNRNKLPPATWLASSAVQMIGTIIWGRMFIMWSDRNLHIGRVGSF